MVAGVRWCQNASMAAVIPSPTKGPRDYKRVLDNLMSSVHHLEAGQEYSYEQVYMDEEKREITPTELVRWLNLRTFGVLTDTGPNTTISPLVGANTLVFWKKAISFHMSDKYKQARWFTGSV
jgi:hypothetical protein